MLLKFQTSITCQTQSLFSVTHSMHTYIHTNTVHTSTPHTNPSPLHTNLPESCPPFRSCSLTLGVPFKTWAEKRGRTHVISTRVHTYCDITPAMATPPDFIFGLERTGGLIIQMTSGDRRRKGEGSSTFGITGTVSFSLALCLHSAAKISKSLSQE